MPSSRSPPRPRKHPDSELPKALRNQPNSSLLEEDNCKTTFSLLFPSKTLNELRINNNMNGSKQLLETLRQALQKTHSLLQDGPSLMMEALFTERELKHDGIVHTPPWVAQMMAALAISGKEQIILDPACGAGVFLHSLLAHPHVKRASILGIEKNPKIAQIARKRIQMLTESLNNFQEKRQQLKIQVRNTDFFDFLVNNKKEVIGKIDLVIGNPPYVRQELITNKQHLASIIEDLSGTAIKIDRKADLYIYFIHACLNILSDDGKLCLIVPDKWMTARYGRSLQKQLLTLSGRTTIVHLQRNIFPRIDVRSVILFFEKKSSSCTSARNQNEIRIIKNIDSTVKKKIISIMNSNKNWPTHVKTLLLDENSTTIDKNTLQLHDKWLTIIKAPNFFLRILRHHHTMPLHNNVFSVVQYGNKTGANDFFFLTSEKLKTWNLPPEYLKPAIKSVKGIQGTTLTNSDFWLLHVPPHVEKDEILSNSSLKDYIEWGMNSPRHFQRRPSCYKSRNPPRLHEKCKRCPITRAEDLCDDCHWFSLPLKSPPDFLLAKVNHVNLLPVYNLIKAHPSDSIQCIHVLDERQRDFLHAYLSSRVIQLAMELMGRWEGGGALTLMIEDTRKLPILNPRKITSEERQNIIQSAKELFKEKSRNPTSCEAKVLHDELDLAILRAWGETPETVEKLKEVITLLQKARLGKY